MLVSGGVAVSYDDPLTVRRFDCGGRAGKSNRWRYAFTRVSPCGRSGRPEIEIDWLGIIIRIETTRNEHY